MPSEQSAAATFAKNGLELISSFLASHQVPIRIRYGKLLDSQFGFPDVVRMLWRQLSQNSASYGALASEFCYLVNKAVEKLVNGEDLG